jgi:acetyl-CoA carboxylase biotin carboxyl carrier protein
MPSGAVIAQAIQAARELADIMAHSPASKLVVCVGAIRWEVERLPPAAPAAPAGPAAARPAAPADQAGPADQAPLDPSPAAGQVVSAPLVGVFYRSPSPGLAPFVELGAQVKAGQQVAIIEAMKTMNEVLAPCAGIVTQIHAIDTEIVEHGQPLITIQPGGATAIC